MIVHKEIRGYILFQAKNDVFLPQTVPSTNWKHWKTTQDPKACAPCKASHGKIYSMHDIPDPAPPLHPNCRCRVELMDAAKAGTCSKEGQNGADWYLWNGRGLPDYYIHIDDLKALGWRYGKVPAKYAPDKMVFGGIYRNDDNHLPDAPGRVWYEADLNYYAGKRNRHRVLYSNDGLMFVTYDHYETFIEVIGG